MTPLAGLARAEEVRAALLGGTSAELAQALARAQADAGGGAAAASSLAFARGAAALRDGRLDDAAACFEQAKVGFDQAGDREASELSSVEAAITLARRGRRESALEAERLVATLVEQGASAEVRARAAVARGTAFRVLGEAARAQQSFAQAITLSADVGEVRAQALNSLGTLCVVLGAFGAAETLCEHAAELCRSRRDVIGEAIAMGQLGAAAVGRGDLDAAKRYLSRQEWLASRVGDSFGRTRALVWLAEVALESGRADDAEQLAEKALASAASVTPPLSTFAAYAERVIGRARLGMGDKSGTERLERARATFAAQRLPLGEALSARDLALAQDPIDLPAVRRALSELASLGLPERVAEGMAFLGQRPEVELALSAQSPRRLEPLEARLVYERPESLALVAESRAAARKNLGRLSVLALSPSGLVVAMLVHEAGASHAALAEDGSLAAALIGGLGAWCGWAWPGDLEPARIASDLARIMGRVAKPRVALCRCPDGRVESAGFGGGLPATVSGVDVGGLVARALQTPEGRVGLDIGDPGCADLRAALSAQGIATQE